MSSYREEICNQDERGRSLFSPYCRPGRTIDTNLTDKVRVKGSTFGDLDCYIPPAVIDLPLKNKHDDNSADEWFKDPTYAQRILMREKDIENDENPSLKLYHKIKSIEKSSASMLQTL